MLPESVLLVSPDPGFAKTMKSVLASFGCRVTVRRGREGVIRAISDTRSEMLMVHVSSAMRDKSLALARTVRETSGCPVFVVTDTCDPDMVADITDLDPCGFIVWPAECDALEAELALAGHRGKVRGRFQATEDLYRMLVENSVDIIWAFSPDMKITYASPAVESVLGYTPEEAMAMSWEEFFTPRSLEYVRERMGEDMLPSLDDEGTRSLELEMRRKDGSTMWGQVSLRILRDDRGNVTGFQGSVRDIDQPKKMEMWYTSFIENTSYGFIRMDARGTVTYANSRALEISGYGPEDVGKLHFSDLISEEDLPRARRALKMKARGIVEPATYRLRRKDGSLRTVEANIVAVGNGNRVEGYHGTVVDITEMEALASSLRQKSDFLDAVVNSTSEGIFVLDEDLRYVFINPASGRMVGHAPEDWLGKRAGSYRHPDDEKVAMEAIMKVLSGEPSRCQVRVRHSSGQYHLLDIRYTLMMMDDRPHILGVVSDVTEARKAEEALRASEMKYRSLFENSPEMIVLLDSQGNILEANSVMCEFLGAASEHLAGRRFGEVIGLDEVGERILARAIEAENAPPGYLETEWHPSRGGYVWVEMLPTRVPAPDGNTIIQIIARNITARKRAEMEMRRQHLSFDMQPGSMYLCRGAVPSQGIRAFGELIGIGFEGVIMSRRPRNELAGMLQGNFMYLRVSEIGGPGTVRPDMDEIVGVVDRLHRGHVVFVECLDYLSGIIGPLRTARLVQRLKDIAVARGHVLMVRADPEAMSPRAMRQIEAEASEFTPARPLRRISSRLLEVLEEVNRFNEMGISPSYTELGESLGISKPTLRSRVRLLKDLGALKEQQTGRKKTLELTDAGSSYLII